MTETIGKIYIFLNCFDFNESFNTTMSSSSSNIDSDAGDHFAIYSSGAHEIPHVICKANSGDNILFFTKFMMPRRDKFCKFANVLEYRATGRDQACYLGSLVYSKSKDKVRSYHHYSVNLLSTPPSLVKLSPSYINGIGNIIKDENVLKTLVE